MFVCLSLLRSNFQLTVTLHEVFPLLPYIYPLRSNYAQTLKKHYCISAEKEKNQKHHHQNYIF